MNFFGHAWLARQHGRDPRFVLGAMLPDLAPMVGLRVDAISPGALADGAAHHHATDAVFHGAAAWTALQVEGARRLRELGLRRGPARGVAHVGSELALDGWIAARFGVPPEYREALATGTGATAEVRFRAGPYARPFAECCRRIAALPVPDAYARASFTGTRVERALAARARLAVSRGERAAVVTWLAEVMPRLDALAPALLHEVGAGLAERGFGNVRREDSREAV